MHGGGRIMAARKTAAKKAVSKKATVSVAGAIPKLKLTMPLDARKVAAIQKCIAKGSLTITLSKVDLIGGKLGDPWLYD
jgi:anti-sigma28 factor (negative regulator of flagellin synthesis)